MVYIIEPSYKIEKILSDGSVLQDIESVARNCYKSEKLIKEGSAEHLVKDVLVKNHHYAMLEFGILRVRFIHNRGFTHELVRHRLASYAQESTRYCNYALEKFGNSITVIRPYWIESLGKEAITGIDLKELMVDQGAAGEHVCFVKENSHLWFQAILQAEKSYLKLIQNNVPPQAARGVLPNDLKTEIVIQANFTEWLHIFDLRTAPSAHPDMLRVMRPLLKEVRKRIPIVFDNVGITEA